MFKKRDFFVFLVVMLILTPFIKMGVDKVNVAWATATRESSAIDAVPMSLYGNYNGTVKRVAVDSTGNMVVSGTSTGNLSLTTLTANTVNATLINLNGSPLTADSVMVYPSSGIALSNGTGWSESIVDNSANWDMAYGWGNHAVAGYATANSVILGAGSAAGSNSVAYGVNANANAQYSVAIGYNSSVTGAGATQGVAVGNNAVSYSGGVAVGYNTNASQFSVAIGPDSKVTAWESVAIGQGANVTSSGLTALGMFPDDDGSGTKSLIVGNGSGKSFRGNAFTVLKNGNAIIGAYLDVTSGGSNNAAACWVGTQLGHCTTNDVTDCGCTL